MLLLKFQNIKTLEKRDGQMGTSWPFPLCLLLWKKQSLWARYPWLALKNDGKMLELLKQVTVFFLYPKPVVI